MVIVWLDVVIFVQIYFTVRFSNLFCLECKIYFAVGVQNLFCGWSAKFILRLECKIYFAVGVQNLFCNRETLYNNRKITCIPISAK
ncbi:MAG: hypothetical protein DRR00_30015 [Candidatus Parabeggiatoa sp. nov. 3]|nr:MAG: hypothetical protein DRR00_30015 [Gammaproteobacteria bacterium]RKZ56527.1 MAG: hypothetical protein DRQ99_28335 [Gammaproteobacteria bacterium]